MSRAAPASSGGTNAAGFPVKDHSPMVSPLFMALLAPVATLADRVPGFFFGLPLVALASLVFAATHHEDPGAIRLAAVHWTVWLGGILGMVLAGVLVLGLIG